MINLIEFLYLRQKNNLVYYDSLTGVMSRMYYDMVAKRKYHGQEVPIAFVDVNDLKRVNDEKGHTAGSQLLKKIASKLQDLAGDYEICRIGGDEFVVIGHFYEAELRAIDGISVGTYLKEAYEDMSSAVKKADKKMYDDKRRKKHMKSELRPCLIDGNKALFHAWDWIAQVVPPSLMVGGAPGGQLSETFGIVEFEDGTINRVQPERIKFLDSGNAFHEQALFFYKGETK